MAFPDKTQRVVTSDALVHAPKELGPHVVILGAGASRAAFPRGDAKGKQLPIMNDLVEVVGLAPLLQAHGVSFQSRNFESLYADLCEDPRKALLRSELEDRIQKYFSTLEMPGTVTLYDRLLLSLRGKDAVLTFNWDPFLFDAWVRNRNLDPPSIYFLHGNVRVRCCAEHPHRWGNFGVCDQCSKPWEATPLLFPVEKKNYDGNPFIKMHWKSGLEMVRRSFTVTVFGYGAPTSDKSAVGLLREAYLGLSNREIEHFEVIDIQNAEALSKTWAPFVPTLHLHIRNSFADSWMGRYPRRTCEGILWPMTEGIPVETYEMPDLLDLVALQGWASKMKRYEGQRSS